MLANTSRHTRESLAIIRKFLWQMQIAKVEEITPLIVQEWLAVCLKAGKSPKTLRNYCSAISRFCEHLRLYELLAANPCRDMRLPRAEQRPARFLAAAEIRQALDLARQHGIYVEVCLALCTGLRVSELIRLQWSHVDLARKILTVYRSKSGRYRSVPLAKAAVEALEIQYALSGHLVYVFPARNTYSGGWSWLDKEREITWWMQAIRPLQDAIPKFLELPGKCTGRGWHLLRHTFASQLAQKGVSLYKIAQWLGHSDVRTTQIYAHLQAGFDDEIEKVSVF